LIDFAGEIIMGQQTTFENNQGVANSNTMKDFVSGSYSERGFKCRLFGFHRSIFTSMSIDGLKFINNIAYDYTTVDMKKTIRPRLIEFDLNDFVEDYKLSINEIEISNNIFKNSDCMVSIFPFNMTYNDFTIKDNGVDVSEDTNEAIIKIHFDPYV
jgi:hypothetical protein